MMLRFKTCLLRHFLAKADKAPNLVAEFSQCLIGRYVHVDGRRHNKDKYIVLRYISPALGMTMVTGRSDCLNAFGGWVPDQFVDLQAEAGGNVVREYPLGEFLGIEETVGSV